MLDDAEREELLHADAGPNLPAEQQRSDPPQRYVPPAERTARRLALERLLVSAPTHEEIYAVMDEKFGMTRDAIRAAIHATYARLAEEHAKRRPYATIEAEARIRGEIHDARKAGKHSAVANLEQVLARVQGTEAPREQHVHIEHGVSDTVLQIWGHLTENDPAKLREIVEAQIQREEAQALPPATDEGIEVRPVPRADPPVPDPAPAAIDPPPAERTPVPDPPPATDPVTRDW